MARGITIAVYVFCLNACFTLIDYVNPFHATTSVLAFYDPSIVNTTAASAQALNTTGGIVEFGLLQMFATVFEVTISLIIGPLKLVPRIMDAMSVDPYVNIVITSVVWLAYAILMFQLITGRTLEAVS